ncbi:MAG: hypothetical protein JO099_04150 [Acidobacteriia bacterium]|nr:hypothetical protein [Terriglobia bacterium]
MESFNKRQKEIRRLERQRDKAARKLQRKQNRATANGDAPPEDGKNAIPDGPPQGTPTTDA